MDAGERVVVVQGVWEPCVGAVIKDQRKPDAPAPAPFDRVWVLLDDSDNPMPFRGAQLEPVR